MLGVNLRDSVTNTRLALLLSWTVYSIPLLVLGINNLVPYQAIGLRSLLVVPEAACLLP